MTFATHYSVLSDSCHIERRAMGKIKSKWDNLDERVQKWASRLGAIATIIGILAAGGGWIINQMDNSVASHIENQTSAIQDEVKGVQDSVQELSDKVDTQELQITRLELMTLMENDPQNTVEIEKLAHYYFQNGGNSYMSSMYAKYCKQYGADCEIMFK